MTVLLGDNAKYVELLGQPRSKLKLTLMNIPTLFHAVIFEPYLESFKGVFAAAMFCLS